MDEGCCVTEEARSAQSKSRINPNSLEDNVGVRIVRLAEVYARLAKMGVEEPWGLRNTDLRILNTLDGADSVPISEASRRTHVDKAWISRSVRDLVDKGLVERNVDPDDNRLSLAKLTDKGRALLDEIRPAVMLHEDRALKGIDAAAFKRELDRLLVNIEAMLSTAEGVRGKA